MKKKLKIIYAGNYSKGKGYPRANVLLEGIESVASLKELRYPLWDKSEDKEAEIKKPGNKILPFLKSFFFFLKNAENLKTADVVIVGFPGYIEIFIFKLLKILTGSGFLLLFDYFFSVYESLVFERKLIKENSFPAKILYFLDKFGLLTADKILIDTKEHRDFICNLFGIKKEKFLIIPVGESEKYFSFLPYPEEKNPFAVIFFGTFLNLHGTDKIKKTAEILEKNKNIKFIMVGRGKNDDIFKQNLPSNIEFINKFIPPSELKKLIEKSHIVLGIFGENERADKVIPCKIYDSLASGRPVITGKTKAAENMFTGKPFVFLCENTPEKIAEKIEETYMLDMETLKSLGKQAYDFFKENFSPSAAGQKLIKEIENEIQR